MKNVSKNIIQFIYLVALFFIGISQGQTASPNILLITLDDMNWDSPNCYGGTVSDLTPNIDQIAKNGMLFQNAYVQSPNCSPSRSVIQTGLYPHQSGMRGFYYVQPNGQTLPEILMKQGYFTGVLNKLADSSLSPDFERYWNSIIGFKGAESRSAEAYAKQLSKFLSKVEDSKKPFYCVVNVADPHKPFFNDGESKKHGYDTFEPSKIYSLNDIEIPEFLVDNPKIKQEMLNYYNSVKRGDDCVGQILKTIDQGDYKENTIVILLSDHGMPLPFAKSSVYPNGVRTPLLISWPNKITPGSINKTNLVSSIDLAPTILELTNNSIPETYVGQSFVDLLSGKTIETNDYVFTQYDENAGGIPRPSRTVMNEKIGYVFNPWATGTFPFKSAADYHTSYKVMKKLSENDSLVKERFNNWVYRAPEELYDYEKDPNALNNLIDDPSYSEILSELREKLMAQMIKTNDYVLPAFKNKEDLLYLNKWMETQLTKANLRTKSLIWKRFKNNNGSTKHNTTLFNINDKRYN
ncbi:MAG: sulfatase [Flavobacteriaceae bacterium]